MQKNKKLTIDELKYVQNEVAYKGKSIKGSYVLAVFLGFLGIHRAYFGKTKSGIARALISIAAIAAGGIIFSSVSTGMSAEAIGAAMVYNTVLAIVFLGLTAISVVWGVIDLFLIPRWIQELDETNEQIATERAIQSRYIKEHLVGDAVVDDLVEEITEKIKIAVYTELKKKKRLTE